MADEMDIRISPTLHPGIAGEIADYDDDTRPLLGQTETAVDEAFKALQSYMMPRRARSEILLGTMPLGLSRSTITPPRS